MVRKTIYIGEAQAQRLKVRAKVDGVTESELLRRAVDAVLEIPPRSHEIRRRAMRAIGLSASGDTDVSECHDEYLAEIYSHDHTCPTHE